MDDRGRLIQEWKEGKRRFPRFGACLSTLQDHLGQEDTEKGQGLERNRER